LFHAEPIDVDEPIETELTRAARKSVDNADRIIETEEFHETDFVPGKVARAEQKQSHERVKKARKQERKRKTKAKARKRK
jgi:hypothetical protein